MIRHDDISAEKRRRNYGRKPPFRGDFPAHLEGPPGLWGLSEFGQPLWIASVPGARSARWGWVIPPKEKASRAGIDVTSRESMLALSAGPTSMPSVGRALGLRLHPGERRPRAVGRPKVEYSDPLIARWAAWANDMRDVSTWEIARRLRPWLFGDVERQVHSDQRSARRRAEVRLDAGRAILARDGILPWVLWERGEVPSGWWADERFAAGLKAWYDT